MQYLPHSTIKYINKQTKTKNMRIITKNLRDGFVKFRISNLDDLWYLSHIIEVDDKLKGLSTRKIKIGEKQIKKTFFLEICVEKTELENNILRVLGKITQGPEDIPLGSYQSILLEDGTEAGLTKKSWKQIHLKRLDEAVKEKSEILIATIDREEATFALLKPNGFTILSNIKGEVERKAFKTNITDFYGDVNKILEDYSERYKINKIVIAATSFWHENISKKLSDSVKKKSVFINSSGNINEILKSEEIKTILKEDRTSTEFALVEKLLEEISKNGKATYGIDYIKKATEMGAIDKLLITDKHIKLKKEENKYNEVDQILQNVENMQGEIFIISSEHDAGRKLEGLGGIGALLRYKIDLNT